MSVKDDILTLLEQNKSVCISGQDIAEKLGVSRAAVWKSIQTLKKDGYNISATTNKGYILENNNDILSSQGIKLYLDNKDIKIVVLNSVTSTNTYGKQLLNSDDFSTTLVVAEEQTNGRGRQGKTFYSPNKTGVYMSLVMNVNLPIDDALFVTIGAGVAVCKAISKLADLSPKIKWVNDIFINGKKACGILTEAVSDFESGVVQSVIVGIGINFKTTDFPQEISDFVTSVNSANLTRNQLAAQVINEFLPLIQKMNKENLINEYKSLSYILNKKISYNKNGETFNATAIDINDVGNLVVTKENNQIEVLKSGEISIGSNNIKED